MNETLKDNFVTLVLKFTKNGLLINELWNEIEQHYTEPTRYYHNLTHIAAVYNKLSAIKGFLVDWDIDSSHYSESLLADSFLLI